MRRPLAVTALTLALVAGTLAAASAEQASAATTASRPGQVCILGICFGPAPTPSPSASSSAPSPVPLPSVPGLVSPSSAAATSAAQKKAADPGLVATSATEVLTAGSATMSGFAYQGNVNVPVAGGGNQAMMKFTADSITLAGGVTDMVTQGGTTTVTTSPMLAFSGGVTLYATKLSGSLAGVPLTFTPSTVSAVLLTVANLITGVAPITLTGVTTDQPLVLAGALQTGALSIS